jgi:hypothetical protein
MSKFEVTFAFTNEDNRDDFLAWMSDGGGEYDFMEAQQVGRDIKESIEHFDYTDAFEAWGYDGKEPPVVRCQTEDEMD